MIYTLLKNKYPKYIGIKKRENEEILIVESIDLEIFYLNETAKYIVNLSNGKNTLEEIKNYLLNVFDVNEDDLKNDLVNSVRDLQWKKIIKLK